MTVHIWLAHASCFLVLKQAAEVGNHAGLAHGSRFRRAVRIARRSRGEASSVLRHPGRNQLLILGQGRCNERDDVILRTQPESDDVAREVRIHRLLSARGVAPTFFVSYTREREHTMVLARFHMDLGQWLRLYAPCTVSMWSMRLCRLLREMASCRIFGLDLKPENVLVNLEPGTTIIQDMRLIDFGGGLCWEKIDTISRDGLYACMLIAFHASLFGRFRSLHASRPFDVPLRRLLQSDCIRREIDVVLFQPAIQRLWANLFPGVRCTESVADCVQHT